MQINLVSVTITIRSLELSNVCFASDRAFYYIESFIILCLLHEVRLQSTEFAFRHFETEIVLKSVKRCALNDDRRRQCPSRRLTIFASFRSVHLPPLVFICLSSSSLLEVSSNPRLEYVQTWLPSTGTIALPVFSDYPTSLASDLDRFR